MSNTDNYYKELSLFNDIINNSHRAWNRLTTISNLKDKGRARDAAAYLDKLDETGRAGVGLLLLAIKKKGLETVKRELNRSIV
tara:strand:+ start:45 stop:293 length:249 start_codon:yes stop_codon:yes gene_type:complete